jgi:hypothetical protein
MVHDRDCPFWTSSPGDASATVDYVDKVAIAFPPVHPAGPQRRFGVRSHILTE